MRAALCLKGLWKIVRTIFSRFLLMTYGQTVVIKGGTERKKLDYYWLYIPATIFVIETFFILIKGPTKLHKW